MATQTGSIDLTASNSVKLAAEAGWQSDLDSYYTKSEIDVTVSGINSTVSTKVGEDEVISSINQSAESVSINANKINLQGAVTISDLSSDAQSATLNSNISVGGRNLLTGTGDWSDISTSTTNSGTVSGDTFTFSVHESLTWYGVNISYPHLPFDNVDGKTLTLSFDYRSDDFSDTTGNHYIYINAAASATINGDRSKYRQISTSAFDGVYVPTTEWQRGSITFDLSEALFNAGSGECNYFYIQFYNHTLNSYQLRHVKLEVGNVATDWSQAQEDLEAYADESAYLTAKPNLSPFFEHDLKDVYNATTNPTGYWNGGGGDYVSGSSTFGTAMENGWVHINRTNSGTSAINTYIRAFANGRTLDDGDYTFLIEFRNVESMPTTEYMYTQQNTDAQIWGASDYGGFLINNADIAAGNQSYQAYYKPVQLLGVSQHGTTGEKLVFINWRIPAGGTITCDLRLSIYEGNYTGPWKSYVDSELTSRMKTAEAGISNAAKTATSYVTDIDSNGITVHPSRSDYATNGGRAVINADGLTVYLGSDDVASYGASARIGKSNSDRVTVDSTNGITIYKGNSKRLQTTANGIDVYGSDGTTNIASFGVTSRIGAQNGYHIDLSPNNMSFVGSDSNTALTIQDNHHDPSEEYPREENYTKLSFYNDASRLASQFLGSDIATGDVTTELLAITEDGDVSSSFEVELLYGRESWATMATNASNNHQAAIICHTSGSTCDIDLSLLGEAGVGSSITYTLANGTGHLDVDGQIVAQKRIQSQNSLGGVALEMANSGNKGVWDTTDSLWIICRTSDGNIVINGDNFSVASSGSVSAGTTVTARGTNNVALYSSASSGDMGLRDMTNSKWIIYRHHDYGIVLGNSAADSLYHRTSTCTVNSTNATIYNSVNHCWQNGAVCTVYLSVNLKSSLANASTVDVATAPENYRPPYAVMGSVYVTDQNVNLQAEILGAGTIRVNNRSGSAVTTSANIYMSFTFAL